MCIRDSVEAVKSGAIRKFIVMAGCDGRMRSRDYYTTFAAVSYTHLDVYKRQFFLYACYDLTILIHFFIVLQILPQ